MAAWCSIRLAWRWVRGDMTDTHLIRHPLDGPNARLEWLREQEREAHEATERIRARRIRQTELAFRRDADFLDEDIFSPPKRKGRDQ